MCPKNGMLESLNKFVNTDCSEDGWMGLRSRLNPYS